MPMATIHKMGAQGDLYHIHFLDQGTDPGYGQGRPGGRPDQGLPGGGGRPDQGLPGSGAHPGNRPPGSGGGGIPDHELPDNPPPQLAPGWTLVLIRSGRGHWEYAAIAPGSPPPRPLPPQGGGQPDQGLPGGGMPGQGRPDQGLPGQGMPPHPSGQPVPPPQGSGPGISNPMPTPQQR